MFKKNIKPILMAGALALATAVSPVVAMTGDDSTVTTDTITIKKYLEYAKGIKSIDQTFEFTITPLRYYTNSTDSTNYKNGDVYPTFTGNRTIDFDITSDVEQASGIITDNKSTELTAVATGCKPGFYVYTLVENGIDNEYVDYNKNNNSYTVTVRVENAANGGVEVTGVSIVNQDETKASTATFTNTYKEMTSFTLTKNITGSGADMKQKFIFNVKFTAPTTSGATTAEIKDGDKVLYTFDLTENGQATTVTLGHNESITVNVPAGTTYTITETGASDYTTEYVQLEGGTKKDNTRDNDKKSVDSGLVYDDGQNSVVFTNTKNSSPLTGVIVNNMPYIALLGASGAGLVVLAASKKRSKK